MEKDIWRYADKTQQPRNIEILAFKLLCIIQRSFSLASLNSSQLEMLFEIAAGKHENYIVKQLVSYAVWTTLVVL